MFRLAAVRGQPWPQWRPPLSGGTTCHERPGDHRREKMPQWSPPLSGGTTSRRTLTATGSSPAAMEPAAERRDDAPGREAEQAGAGAAMELLPGAQDPHFGGVHDADEEPGISGGVVGQVPGHVGEVPD